jgi:hypothetical protein
MNLYGSAQFFCKYVLYGCSGFILLTQGVRGEYDLDVQAVTHATEMSDSVTKQ